MALKYQTTNSDWGLSALLDGQQLTFSARFSSEAKWQKFFPFLRTQAAPDPESLPDKLNVFSLFNLSATRAFCKGLDFAKKRNSQIGAEDLFLGLLKEPEIAQLFKRLQVSTNTAEIFLNNYLKLSPDSRVTTDISKLPFAAYQEAVKLHCGSIAPANLLYGLLEVLPYQHILQAVFANIGLSTQRLEILTVWQQNLDYNFPGGSINNLLLRSCRQAELLEEHFGYYFDYNAIDAAVRLGKALPLRLLVKAGLAAKKLGKKNISQETVISIV